MLEIAGVTDAYLYQMEAPDFMDLPYTYSKGCDENSCHGVELSYIFGSFKNIGKIDPSIDLEEVSEEMLALSDNLMEMYLNFLKTGTMPWAKYETEKQIAGIYDLEQGVWPLELYH